MPAAPGNGLAPRTGTQPTPLSFGGSLMFRPLRTPSAPSVSRALLEYGRFPRSVKGSLGFTVKQIAAGPGGLLLVHWTEPGHTGTDEELFDVATGRLAHLHAFLVGHDYAV